MTQVHTVAIDDFNISHAIIWQVTPDHYEYTLVHDDGREWCSIDCWNGVKAQNAHTVEDCETRIKQMLQGFSEDGSYYGYDIFSGSENEHNPQP